MTPNGAKHKAARVWNWESEMRRTTGRGWLRRSTASVVVITYLAGCTHMPSGEKAFESFDSCFAANLGLAAVGGVAVGALGAQLAKQFTGSASTARTLGATAGIAAAAMIAMTAWRKCAAVYNKSEPIARPGEPRPPEPQAGPTRKAALNLARLDIRVDGTENDPPIPEFDFSFFTENPASKDIKAKFRHKVEIVRFKAGDDDKLVLADAKGDAMLDASGKQIPLEAAIRMPRSRLQWVSIAEEGKDDYVEDVIIQQGQRMSYRHKLQVPPRDKLPLPLPVPMRYTLSIEAENMKSTRAVDFAILGTGERPKRYVASAPSNTTEAAAGPVAIQTRALKEKSDGFAATHTTKRKVSLFGDTKPTRKAVASLNSGARVRVDERATVKVNNKDVEWVKVAPETGKGGWLQASELSGLK
jgi:hypothetical protein